MKLKTTNRPAAEKANHAELLDKHAKSPSGDVEATAVIDTTPLPTGMRERVETVEVSTFKPKA